MAEPSPNSFDYFSRGESLESLLGSVDPSSFDYFSRLEPPSSLIMGGEEAEQLEMRIMISQP